METKTNNSNSKAKALFATIGILATLIFITCIVFHITPSVLADSIINFAIYHYFLIGLISFTIALSCWKIYTTLDEKIEARSQKIKTPYTRMLRKKAIMVKNLRNLYFKKAQDESLFIKPEEVSTLKFTNEDVLKDEKLRIQRQRDLQKAMVLGNSFKQKVILLFKDYKSNKHLMTTVWHSSSEYISLKGGVVLPVKSIYKIEF